MASPSPFTFSFQFNPVERFFLNRFLKKYGIQLGKGPIDMSTIASAILGFLSSPLGQEIIQSADTELKTLFTNFLKGHIKAATPAA